MPPIEMGPLRPIGAIDNRLVRPTDTAIESPVRGADTRALVASDALDPGVPPVDAERVSEIRRAIENGTYPVIPVRVADAMIAAGLLLSSLK